MSPLLATAQRAFDTVPLYRALYGARPEREADIPFISTSALHRVTSPLDFAVAAEKVRGAVPSYIRTVRRLPVTVLESEAEWLLRLDRLRHALTEIGVPPEPGRRYAIVAGDSSGPFASDVSNFLAWDGVECSVLLATGSVEDLRSTLEALSPDVILLAGPVSVVPLLPKTGARLAIFVHVDAPVDDVAGLDRLLVSDELFVMGAARAGDTGYAFDRRSVLAEADPASGRLAVTTIGFDCFALVRYCLDVPAGGLADGRDHAPV